ncbi:hypothetical protein CR513_22381, partial [Mucuna pruriens]
MHDRSSTNLLHAFDSKIELTLRRIRKNRKTIINSGSVDFVLDSNFLLTSAIVSSANLFIELGQMENHDRTLKELATPDVVYQPWRRPPQASQRISRGLFHDEAVRNP